LFIIRQLKAPHGDDAWQRARRLNVKSQLTVAGEGVYLHVLLGSRCSSSSRQRQSAMSLRSHQDLI